MKLNISRRRNLTSEDMYGPREAQNDYYHNDQHHQSNDVQP